MRHALLLILFWTFLVVPPLFGAAVSEDITFPSSDGLTLEGTLRLPDIAAVNGKVPGVLLVHGSGPISRDSVLPGQLNMLFGFNVSIFRDIGNALQDAGIAVLTYDKRSCGTFNGFCNNSYPVPSLNISVYNFAEDALAGVKYLQTREEIDDITVVGHSQSGQFVPLLLDRAPEIKRGVILAGPFHPVDVILEYQLNSTIELLQAFGVNETVAEPILEPLMELVQGLENIRNGSDEPVGGAPAAFWQSWFDIGEESLDAATTMDQPVLVLGGEQDRNVPPSEARSLGGLPDGDWGQP